MTSTRSRQPHGGECADVAYFVGKRLMVEIREELPADRDAVREVHDAAFGRGVEGRLVERLRDSGAACIGLVAVEQGTVVGHVLFSPVRLMADAERAGMGLAPMAVVPARQGRGVGSDLVRAGLAACREAGVGFVVVLGHPGYPRFGFETARSFSVECEYDVPDEAFMALELVPGSLGGGGRVVYHPAFSELEEE